MANGLAIAGLLADLAGAVLLAAALAFERMKAYVVSTRWALFGGANLGTDIGRAKETAQALSGMALLGVGFAGQLAAAAGARVDADHPLPYLVAVAVMALAICAVSRERRRRERAVLRIRQEDAARADERVGLWVTWARALRSLGAGPWEGESIQAWAERRYGRKHCAKLPAEPPKAVLLPER